MLFGSQIIDLDRRVKCIIIDSKLEAIKQKFSKMGTTVVIAGPVREFFSKQWTSDMGIRMIHCMISQNIEDPLAEMVLPILGMKKYQVDVVDEKIRVTENEVTAILSGYIARPD